MPTWAMAGLMFDTVVVAEVLSVCMTVCNPDTIEGSVEQHRMCMIPLCIWSSFHSEQAISAVVIAAGRQHQYKCGNPGWGSVILQTS